MRKLYKRQPSPQEWAEINELQYQCQNDGVLVTEEDCLKAILYDNSPKYMQQIFDDYRDDKNAQIKKDQEILNKRRKQQLQNRLSSAIDEENREVTPSQDDVLSNATPNPGSPGSQSPRKKRKKVIRRKQITQYPEYGANLIDLDDLIID